MCMQKTPWQLAAEFHGHVCPGLAIGYRAAEAAARNLGPGRALDEEMVAIVENDSCAVDAVQFLTGCTVGKGNLIFRNFGKQVYTIGRRGGGKAVRVALKYGAMPPEGSMEERVNVIMHAPLEELFDVREVELELPKKAVIFNTIQCAECGEGVMEAKARLKNGKTVCPACFEEYTRGW